MAKMMRKRELRAVIAYQNTLIDDLIEEKTLDEVDAIINEEEFETRLKLINATAILLRTEISQLLDITPDMVYNAVDHAYRAPSMPGESLIQQTADKICADLKAKLKAIAEDLNIDKHITTIQKTSNLDEEKKDARKDVSQ